MSDPRKELPAKSSPTRSFRDIELPSNVQASLTVLYDSYNRRAHSEGSGIVALFCGRAGTGKTEAAEALAGELGLDLYRVDLAALTSKYIGETEKNLARILEQAEAAGAILFFDEADALLGKRTDVEDAHDRYADVDVGGLLERIERYPGIAIIATNRCEELADGFIRPLRTLFG